MTPTAIAPGPLRGEQLRACWPALRPYVIEAVQGQPDDVRALMGAVLTAVDENPMTFTVADGQIVCTFLGVPIAVLPIACLADNDQAH